MHLSHFGSIISCKCICLLECLLLGNKCLLLGKKLSCIIVITCCNCLLCVSLKLINLCRTLIEFSLGSLFIGHNRCCLCFNLSQITLKISHVLINHLLRILTLIKKCVNVSGHNVLESGNNTHCLLPPAVKNMRPYIRAVYN